MTTRNVLLYFALKYNGNWNNIFNAIQTKEQIDENEAENTISSFTGSFITILDDIYPESLKRAYKPPFVLFYEGDINLLKDHIVAVDGFKLENNEHCEITESIIKSNVISFNADKMVELNMISLCEKCDRPYIAITNGNIDKLSNISQCTKRLILSESMNFSDSNLLARTLIGISSNLVVLSSKDKIYTEELSATALNQCKDIYVIPEPILSKSYNNDLIKNGAYLLDSKRDVETLSLWYDYGMTQGKVDISKIVSKYLKGYKGFRVDSNSIEIESLCFKVDCSDDPSYFAEIRPIIDLTADEMDVYFKIAIFGEDQLDLVSYFTLSDFKKLLENRTKIKSKQRGTVDIKYYCEVIPENDSEDFKIDFVTVYTKKSFQLHIISSVSGLELAIYVNAISNIKEEFES